MIVTRYLLYISILYCFCACNRTDTLFVRIFSNHSGISFNNKVTENDSINPIDAEFLYNGGGVAVGDFNKDGRPDLYFTASQVFNRMYLNEGDFTFRDITSQANVSGEGHWCNAASVVVINNDSWEDIYVCATISKSQIRRANLLYINQGLNTDGLPVFKEMAKEYNLADTGYSVHAAFFDYDRDGDLDMYLVTTTPAL
ncbi:MAG: VCBS repeat-containing protein [Chitinophagaceae bacterium]